MPETSPPYAFHGLDRIFHERARLGIVTSLAGQADGVSFADLKRLCGLTDGNLSRHMQALDEAGLVIARKEPLNARGSTRYHLTELGREKFLTYLAALEQALKEAAVAANRENGRSPARI